MAEKNGIFITDSEVYSLKYDIVDGVIKPLNIIRNVPTNIYSSINLRGDNFYKNILPKNCRYIVNGKYNTYNTKNVMIIEDPPLIRTVKIGHNILESEAKKMIFLGKKSYIFEKSLEKSNVTISLPYVIYMIFFNRDSNRPYLNIYYKLSPIRSIDDFLIFANLPNVTLEGEVCIGDFSYKNDECKKYKFVEIAEQLISHFWSSQFNDEITESYGKQRNLTSMFLEWQYYTKMDPTFIFNEKWKYHEKNISEIIGIDFKDNRENIIDLFNKDMCNVYEGSSNSDYDEGYEDEEYDTYEYFIDDYTILKSGSYIMINKVKYFVLAFRDKIIKLLDVEKNEECSIEITKELSNNIKKQIENSKINKITLFKKNFVVGDNYFIKRNIHDFDFCESFSVSKLEEITKNKNGIDMLRFSSGLYPASETFVTNDVSKININNNNNVLLNKNILLFTHYDYFIIYEEFIIYEICLYDDSFLELKVKSCYDLKNYGLDYSTNPLINFSFDVDMFKNCEIIDCFKIEDKIYKSDNNKKFHKYKDRIFCKSLDLYKTYRKRY